jgi:large subunit ribosomal protein L9
MEIILLEDIEKVGQKHTIVKVRDGYGRNYLIPRKMAIIANAANRAKLNELKAQEAKQEAHRLAEYQAIADKLRDQSIKIGAKAGTSGKIFGSVTSVQLATALKEQFDLDVDRRKIDMPEEVKMLGEYVAELKLHPEVEIKIPFEVVAE